ncbi:hypothetical protein THRCLA_11785 [Thraustotheca clavata]|uniref:C2 NT-type domain-containing protein n=1 Tax=Thraustotheca clavata TaxID=74557 RepID=A0A1V9Y6R3_9STRA|nr:hypothetical protein THRCLA_11785 [Thraustotheca clavata]
MSRFFRAATHAGKTGVGFQVHVTLHRLTTTDPDVKEAESVCAVVVRGNHKLKSSVAKIGAFRGDTGSRHVQWNEEVLTFHSTMYRGKNNAFLSKPMTVEILKCNGDGQLATFEVDLATFISEKNGGVNSCDTSIQAKKSWGNASLMITISSNLDSDRPITASSTASAVHHDQETSEHEDSLASPEKRKSIVASNSSDRRPSHIVQSSRPNATLEPLSEEDTSASAVNIAAQMVKYDRTTKELQAKVESLTLQLSDSKEQNKVVHKEMQDWKTKHTQLGTSHTTLQEEMASLREKKAKAEKEVVLRRTELQNTLESSSRVNVVQLERIRHLTSVNEDLKSKVHELQTASDNYQSQIAAIKKEVSVPAVQEVRKMSSWSEGQNHEKQTVASNYQTAPPAIFVSEVENNTVAEQVVRLQGENKSLHETSTSLQREVENLENQLFERSSELQHVLELHAHANATLTQKTAMVQQLQEELAKQTQNVDQVQVPTNSNSDDLVAMLRGNIEELQEEITTLQVKNKQLRESKTKAEEEVYSQDFGFAKSHLTKTSKSSRRQHYRNRGIVDKDKTILELKQLTVTQEDSITKLQQDLRNVQEELTVAIQKPPQVVHVRDVLGTHFPTQMQPQAVEQARAASQLTITTTANVDADVAYLKQQLRELKEINAKIEEDLKEKRTELQSAITLHTRMQADSQDQLKTLEMQIERLQTLKDEAQTELSKLQKDYQSLESEKQALNDKLELEIREKITLQSSLEAVQSVNEEVTQAKIQEAVAQVSIEISGLTNELQSLQEENERIKTELHTEILKNNVASEVNGLKAQIQELKQEIKHLQFELSEKTVELESLRQPAQENSGIEPIQQLLDERNEELEKINDQLASALDEVDQLHQANEAYELDRNDNSDRDKDKIIAELQEQLSTSQAEVRQLQEKHLQNILINGYKASAASDSDSEDEATPSHNDEKPNHGENDVKSTNIEARVSIKQAIENSVYEAELIKLRQELESCRVEIEELKSTPKSTAADIERISELELALCEAQEQLTKSPQIGNSSIQEDKQRITELEELLKKVQEEVCKQGEPIANIEAVALSQELQATKAKLDIISVEIDQANARNAALQAQIDSSLTTSSEDIVQLKAENEFFQSELIASKLKLAQLQEKYDNLNSEYKKVEKELVLSKIQAAEAALKTKKKK